jgi:hypothetical protein
MTMYKKDDVDIHSEGFGRRGHPAVNVKVQKFPSLDLEERFGCSEEQAEKAGQFAFEAACQRFWEEVDDIAREIFGKHVKVYSEGRSGGWAVVNGLDSIEEWDAVMLGKWHKFENTLKKEVEYLTSKDYVLQEIEANEWYKDGSEEYNFYEFKDGHSESIPDLKKKAADAGFAAVIR